MRFSRRSLNSASFPSRQARCDRAPGGTAAGRAAQRSASLAAEIHRGALAWHAAVAGFSLTGGLEGSRGAVRRGPSRPPIRPDGELELKGLYERYCQPGITNNNSDYVPHIKELEKWRKQSPDLALPLVVLAKAYVCFAWDARGSGFAGTVSEVGWVLFRERIEHAGKLLSEALAKGVQDPEAYRLLIDVARAGGGSREEVQAWVDEARELYPVYFRSMKRPPNSCSPGGMAS